MNIIDIRVIDKRLFDLCSFDEYATSGSCGFDLRAMLDKKLIVFSNQVVLIHTGISIFIKNPLISAMILPRSGLGHNHGIILGNTIGLIDSDYQGELMVSIWNRSMYDFCIFPGNRIAQLIFVPIIKPIFHVVSDFKHTKRNIHGFGHSGI